METLTLPLCVLEEAETSPHRVLPLTLHHVFSLPCSSLSSVDLAWKVHKCLSSLPRLLVAGVYSVSASAWRC